MSTKIDVIRFSGSNQQEGTKVTGSKGDGMTELLAQIAALKEKAERDGGSGDQLLDDIRNLENLINLLQKMKAGGTDIDPSQIKALEGQIQALFNKINTAYPTVINNLEDDVAGMKAVNGTQDSSGEVSFSNGSLAEVMDILRKLQNSYTKLMKLYQEVAQCQIEMSAKVVQASAEATKMSIYQEANKEKLDALTSTLSAGVSGYGLYKQGQSYEKFSEGLTDLRTQQSNLGTHQAAIKAYEGPDAAIRMGGPADPDPVMKGQILGLMKEDRYEQFGHSQLGENQAVVNMMKPEQLNTYKGYVDAKSSQVTEQIAAKYKDHDQEVNMLNSRKDIAMQSMNSGMAGWKSCVDKDRARYQQAATLGHANVDSLNKGIDTNRQTAKEFIDQANKVIDDITTLNNAARATG